MFKQKASEIEQLISELKAEESRLAEKLQTAAIGASQVKTVEALMEELDITEEELRATPFETRRKIIEALDIRGEVAPKDGGRVLRVKWYRHSKEFGLENRVASSSASLSAAGP
jgi:hypothetical protein